MKVGIRRVYESPGSDEGFRILVDRVWPRGVRKEELQYDYWAKELAPTPELRKWFGHSPQRWVGFQERYLAELKTPEAQERLAAVAKLAGGRRITLLYGARDTEHNQAVVLADVFRKR